LAPNPRTQLIEASFPNQVTTTIHHFFFCIYISKKKLLLLHNITKETGKENEGVALHGVTVADRRRAIGEDDH